MYNVNNYDKIMDEQYVACYSLYFLCVLISIVNLLGDFISLSS